jgi:hypothetical protein
VLDPKQLYQTTIGPHETHSSLVALQLVTLPTGGIYSHANSERLIYASRRTRPDGRTEITGSLDVEARGGDAAHASQCVMLRFVAGEGVQNKIASSACSRAPQVIFSVRRATHVRRTLGCE